MKTNSQDFRQKPYTEMMTGLLKKETKLTAAESQNESSSTSAKNKENRSYTDQASGFNSDKTIKCGKFSSAMYTTICSFDHRIKLIEENQHRIANSLSRFLDKMNSLLFKESASSKRADGEGQDGLDLCKPSFPHFVEDIMNQIGAIINSTEDLQDLQNESSSVIVTSMADQLKDGNIFLPNSDQTEVQNPAILKKPSSKDVLKDDTKENLLSSEKLRKTTAVNDQSYASLKQADDEVECLECQKQMGSHLCKSNKKNSAQKNSHHTFSNQKLRQSTQQLETSINSKKPMRESLPGSQQLKKLPTTPNMNISSSQSQATFNSTASQAQQNTNLKQAPAAGTRKRIDSAQSNTIDFFQRDQKGGQDQKALSKTKFLKESETQQIDNKSRTRLFQGGRKEPINVSRDKSNNTRPTTANVGNTASKKQSEPKPTSHSYSAVKNQPKNYKSQKQQLFLQQNNQAMGQFEKPGFVKTARSPREDILNNYSSTQAANRNQGSHQQAHTPRIQVQPIQHKEETRTSQSPSARRNFDFLELQKPSQIQINNNILVDDQSSFSKDIASQKHQDEKPARNNHSENFKKLSGDVLDCISEYLGQDDIPSFAFVCKDVLAAYTEYQVENLTLQGEMIAEQIEELKQNSLHYKENKSAHSFVLPDELEEKIETLQDITNWEKLLKDISQNKLSLKEVIVIRIYFTFLNFKNASPSETDTQAFLKICAGHIRKHLGPDSKQPFTNLCDPQQVFKFTEDIKYRSMELMMKVDLNELISAKFCPLVEAMLFAIVEAVAYIDEIPKEDQVDDSEIGTLEYVKETYQTKLEKVEALQRILLSP